MNRPQLMIVGNFGATCQVGRMMGEAARSLGLAWRAFDNNPAIYAASLGRRPGRVWMRISGGRPWEWSGLSRRLAAEVRVASPRVLLVSGSFPLSPAVLRACREQKVRLANFATDDPWSRHQRRHNRAFFHTVRHYDVIANTKARAADDYRELGARRVENVFFAFDPTWHRLPDSVPESVRQDHACDLCFVGTGNPRRVDELAEIARMVPGCHFLYGNDWGGRVPAGWTYRGEALDNRFRLAVHEARITLALLRKGSRDDSTQRTFEIAPCGGTGIYEDTEEHRQILSGYPREGFFDSLAQLGQHCRILLREPRRHDALRDAGRRLIVREENTFAARLKSILRWVEEPADGGGPDAARS